MTQQTDPKTPGRRLSPRRIMAWFGAFFIAYAVIALARDHRLYAAYSGALSLVWFVLAGLWRDERSKP